MGPRAEPPTPPGRFATREPYDLQRWSISLVSAECPDDSARERMEGSVNDGVTLTGGSSSPNAVLIS